MPTNEIYKEARYIPLTVGASVDARSPVVVGKIPGVTLTATASTGTTVATVATEGVFDISVHADNTENNTGSTTVAVGDILYHNGTNGASAEVNKCTSGVRFGYALEANSSSGSVATIKVLVGY
jgi:hypothetical protein